MSTSPAEKPTPGVVTFTAQGNRALDRLAAGLVDACDGSPASIADVLERVLSADIAELADALSETTRSPTASQAHATRADHEISETGPRPRAQTRQLAGDSREERPPIAARCGRRRRRAWDVDTGCRRRDI